MVTLIFKRFVAIFSVISIGVGATLFLDQKHASSIPKYKSNAWIEKIREYEREQKITQPGDVLNSAIEDLDINYGRNGSAEQEELLQLSCNGDSEGLRRRHDRCSYRFGF